MFFLSTWMTLPELLASSTRQDGDIQRISTVGYVYQPYLKSHLLWPSFFHIHNWGRKTRIGGVVLSPPPKKKIRTLNYTFPGTEEGMLNIVENQQIQRWENDKLLGPQGIFIFYIFFL